MTAPSSVDFVIVAYRNDAAELHELATGLRRAAAAEGWLSSALVVVNDGETMLLESPQLRVIRGQGNVGFAAGVAIGVQRSRAEFVVIVNPDCLPPAGQLRAFLAHLSPGCGIVVPRLLDAYGAFDFAPYEDWTFPPGRRLAAFLCKRELPRRRGGPLPRYAKAPGAFLGLERRVALELDAPFDRQFFLYAEDRDLTDRARRAGIPIRLAFDVEITHLGGVSGRSEASLVSACKTDGSLRVAYRRFGSAGARAFAAAFALERGVKSVLGRSQGRPEPAAWAVRRWRAAGMRDPGRLTAELLSAEPWRRPASAPAGRR